MTNELTSDATYNKLQFLDTVPINSISNIRMNINLVGRIDNIVLGQHKPLQPLFESIVNSLHAIESLNTRNGRIKIVVLRDESQGNLVGNNDFRPVTGFTIEDNGIGFDNDNYISFSTSDTKFKKGAKGIGRFMWLKAFEKVQIQSVFSENGTNYERSFDFLKTSIGIENHSLKETDKTQRKTTVNLINYYSKYQENCQKTLETLGEKIIEHCLIYFLGVNCPSITIQDSQEKINLNDIFNSNVRDKTKSVNFKVKGKIFNVTNLRLYLSEEANHKVHFCANDRVVTSRDIGKKIPDLRAKLLDEENKVFKFAAYVQAEFLDENVNPERTEFTIIKEKESDELFPNLISFEEVEQNTLNQIKDYLKPYLQPIAENKIKRITNFVEEKAPQYRAALKYKPESIDHIVPGLSDDKLEIELHKINASIDVELKERSNKVLNKTNEEIIDLPKYIEEYKNLIEEITDFSKSQLAQYVVHRKIIIDLLDKSLSINEEGKYHLENTVHGIIFPLRTSSSDVDYEQQNLWIIDERLSYHRYLASDKRFDEMHIIDVNSKDRPDLMVFNSPLAYAESSPPYSSVVIVEFKRPMRKHYDETDDNPFEQVYDYIRKIQDSSVVDKVGKPININPNTPFYAYVICDITKKISAIAENYNLTKTPDGLGYFGFNQKLSAYVELISYTKLIEDAKKRNKILFDKLHIPNS